MATSSSEAKVEDVGPISEPTKLSVKLKSYRYSKGGNGPTFYELAVQDGDRSWVAWKRYSDFDALHHTLKHSPSVKDVLTCSLPPKRWLKNSATVIAERSVKLDAYLQGVCACEAAATHPSFAAFLKETALPDDTDAGAGAGAGGAGAGAGASGPSIADQELTALTAMLRDAEAAGDDSKVAAACFELGVLCRADHKFEDAERHLLRALVLRQDASGPAQSPSDAAAVLNSLGNLFAAQRNYRRATEYYNQAVEIQTGLDDDLAAADTLTNLACVEEATNDLAGAEEHFLRALAIQKDRRGEHPTTAATLANLGTLYQKLRRPAEAEDHMKQAVAILTRVSRGAGDAGILQDTATALQNLGSFYQKARRFEEAVDCFTRAAGCIEDAYGPTSLAAASACTNLAGMLKKLEHYDRAKPLYCRARDIRSEKLGPDSVEAANASYNLGLLCEKMSEYSDAEECFAAALRVYTARNMARQMDTTTKFLRRVKEKRSMLDKPKMHLLHK